MCHLMEMVPYSLRGVHKNLRLGKGEWGREDGTVHKAHLCKAGRLPDIRAVAAPLLWHATVRHALHSSSFQFCALVPTGGVDICTFHSCMGGRDPVLCVVSCMRISRLICTAHVPLVCRLSSTAFVLPLDAPIVCHLFMLAVLIAAVFSSPLVLGKGKGCLAAYRAPAHRLVGSMGLKPPLV